jgi:4'-phosphopantetheinyl transferase EntD
VPTELEVSYHDPVLAAALASMAPPGILLEHRLIASGDETALLPTEAPAFHRGVAKVRRQSGAARIAARRLATAFGLTDVALPRSASGATVWPTGLVGSLAHDDAVAVAALASDRNFAGIGIDVEPALPLPAGLVEVIATSAERRRYGAALVGSRLLFAAKEAVYKAQFPLDRERLGFHDVEIDLEAGRAHTRHGRSLAIAVRTHPRTLALAFIPAATSAGP